VKIRTDVGLIWADVALLHDFRHFPVFRKFVVRIQENGEIDGFEFRRKGAKS
jgi:hypothetical protein